MSNVHGTVVGWGGECEVDSAIGLGTTIRLRFCISDQEPDSPVEVGDPVPVGRRGAIIVVEDEESICTFLVSTLSRQHQVDAFQNGTEALDQFSAGKYDVALIDLGMPGLPGDQLALRLRETDPAIITVLVTGWALEEDDPRLSHFDFRLTKPARSVAIRHTVTRAIDLYDTRRS